MQPLNRNDDNFDLSFAYATARTVGKTDKLYQETTDDLEATASRQPVPMQARERARQASHIIAKMRPDLNREERRAMLKNLKAAAKKSYAKTKGVK